jgi:DNA transposition AAA+ family ATPase
VETIQKQNICNALRKYCDRYESQNRAAASLKGVSAATISLMLSGSWGLIRDEMWRNVASQIGFHEDKWLAAETTDYVLLNRMLDDARENHLVLAVTGSAGSGKTFALKNYTSNHKQTYMLCCNEYWNRKTFMTEMLAALGREGNGRTVGEMMGEVVRWLKMQENPLLILDEADKLSDHVLYFFIS